MTEPTQAPTADDIPAPLRAAPALSGVPDQPGPGPEPVQAAPKKKVTLDLDALDAEQPRDDRPEPYSIRLQGQEFVFEDPEELDWQDLQVGEGNPRLMLHVILGNDEQRTRFFGLKGVKVRQMRAITEGYAKHYGLGEEGEDGGSARS